MHTYSKDLNGEENYCEVCGTYDKLVQHHTSHRRYSENAIWVCDKCHKRIHTNPSWAYEQGYLVKHNATETKKKTKTKSCGHKKIYFNPAKGKQVCQLCGKVLDSLNND